MRITANTLFIGLALTITATLSSAFASAVEQSQPAQQVAAIKHRMDAEAASLDLDYQTYKRAVDQYMRVMLGDSEPDMPKFDDLAQAGQLDNLSAAEQLTLLNTQRALFASWLGLPVHALLPFLRLMPEKPEHYEQWSDPLNKREVLRVMVYCRDQCKQKSDPWDLEIAQRAREIQIADFQRFEVQFVNSNNLLVDRAAYTISNFSGAWRVGDLPLNCAECALQ